MQFRVGVTVLATIIITALLVAWFGKVPHLMEGSYTIYITFPEAPGVSSGTPIRKNGIRIGRVTDVQFRDQEADVIITASIEGKYRLLHNWSCEVNTNPLGLSDTTLEFTPVREKKDEPIRPGETLRGVPPTASNPMQVISDMQKNMDRTFRSLQETSNELGKFVQRVDRLFDTNEERISRIIKVADDSMGAFQNAIGNVNEVIGDANTRNQLKAAVNELPGLFHESRQTVAKIQEAAASAQTNLENLEGLTRPLGQYGKEIVDRVLGTLQNLDTLVTVFSKFSEGLSNPNGSLGQIINNPDLYQHINGLVARLDTLSQELRPILDDARVFTDKIARHPEMLGVRGAIENRPGIK